VTYEPIECEPHLGCRLKTHLRACGHRAMREPGEGRRNAGQSMHERLHVATFDLHRDHARVVAHDRAGA
jgi:hypothetical protein